MPQRSILRNFLKVFRNCKTADQGISVWSARLGAPTLPPPLPGVHIATIPPCLNLPMCVEDANQDEGMEYDDEDNPIFLSPIRAVPGTWCGTEEEFIRGSIDEI